MKRSSLRGLALVAVMVTAGCASPTAPGAATAPAAGQSPAAQAIATAVFDLTSAERVNAGLAPLASSATLTFAAQLHSDQMAALSRMEHVLTGAPYPNPSDRLAAAGYAWQAYGENIAMGYTTAASVVAAWMNSPGHRANILSTSHTELGVGYALDAAGRPYYTQVFARPSP